VAPDETPEEKLATLERQLRRYQLPIEESVPLFAPLFSLQVPADRYPPLNVSPQRQRQKTLESLVAMLLELAEREPVLFILEDLHWTDPTTLEFLSLLVEHVPAVALYTLLTCRPHFQPAWHHRSYVTAITVNRLSRQHIAPVAEHVAGGKTLPDAVLQQIVEKTDGVPLFVEEVTKAVLESGVLQDTNGQYALTGSLSAFSIPATLHDSLLARLDRLVTAKAVAQYGAVLGRQFSYALLHAVSHLDEATLRRELGRLVEAELIYQRGLPPGATYTFKHALIQDAAYASLLRSTRQEYHRRIAEVLKEQFPALAAAQPEVLARHYTEAGLHAEAMGYWQQAGEQAIQRSAHAEAVSHLRNGLALLDLLPDAAARLQHELLLLTALGPTLMAIQGFGAPEVGDVYTRAHQLCQQVGETPQRFLVLRGLWQFSILRTELRTAHALGAQLLRLAQRDQDAALLLEAHRALGEPLFWLGEFPAAHGHFEQELAHYDPQQHRAHTFLYGLDPGVTYLAFAARTPMTCWLRCTRGSPKALTLLTSRTPRRCWRRWRNATPGDTPEELDGAFAAMTRAGAEALLVFHGPFFTTHRLRIVELATQHRLPGIYHERGDVVAGGLMTDWPHGASLLRRAATYVDKILKGPPTDLPVEQPTKPHHQHPAGERLQQHRGAGSSSRQAGDPAHVGIQSVRGSPGYPRWDRAHAYDQEETADSRGRSRRPHCGRTVLHSGLVILPPTGTNCPLMTS
jgi:tetratricopeptide (TPR) repeat protein